MSSRKERQRGACLSPPKSEKMKCDMRTRPIRESASSREWVIWTGALGVCHLHVSSTARSSAFVPVYAWRCHGREVDESWRQNSQGFCLCALLLTPFPVEYGYSIDIYEQRCSIRPHMRFSFLLLSSPCQSCHATIIRRAY